MPSKSPQQHRLMAMVAHSPAAAKRLGIPQKVGREFVAADLMKEPRKKKGQQYHGQIVHRKMP